jgi:hypothetical protein
VLKSLCEICNSWITCAAPTVLGILTATVPSPPGLGYDLSRLRRFDFLAVIVEPFRGNSRLVTGHAAPEARKTVAQCGSTGDAA